MKKQLILVAVALTVLHASTMKSATNQPAPKKFVYTSQLKSASDRQQILKAQATKPVAKPVVKPVVTAAPRPVAVSPVTETFKSPVVTNTAPKPVVMQPIQQVNPAPVTTPVNSVIAPVTPAPMPVAPAPQQQTQSWQSIMSGHSDQGAARQAIGSRTSFF